MAKELDAILDHGDAQPAASCIGDNGSVSYLKQVICPVYETMPKYFFSLVHVLILQKNNLKQLCYGTNVQEIIWLMCDFLG
ncbi:hypothetical protein MKW94_019091 [Papaver nudicaule]|uniref:Uncharacterized protein n=1 Tax=Papaver nudicaule TaxID=74823 RepID=A0AA42AXM8_PAPNU|nr:hypothetical protein [Papaver nudicaule]MCL7043545.1 hypothetical protein [Papaver nudicaule]